MEKCEKDILQLLNRTKSGEESESLFEVKIDSPDNLAAEICAFANSKGGVLLVDVSDTGNIVGITPEEARGLNQLVSNVCSLAQ